MPKQKHYEQIVTTDHPIRYAIYARSSVDSRSETTLDSQEFMCRREITARGGQVVAVYTDADRTGWNVDREGFQAMREAAAQKKFDAIMMWKFDRLARDYNQTIMLKTLFRHEYKIKLYCVQGFSEDDDDSPRTAMMEEMMGIVASFYSRNLSNEVKRAYAHRHDQGKFNGTFAPLGYLLATEKTPTHHRAKKATETLPPGLHLLPREAVIVRRAFRLYATGNYSYQTIADFLNSKAKYLNLNGKAIGIDWVREMLQNRLYCGEVSYAENIYKEGFRQKVVSDRGRKSWHSGIHQAIITTELFDVCQGIRQKHGGLHLKVAAPILYLLAGKLWCSYCLASKETSLKDNKYGLMYCRNHKQRYSETLRYYCPSQDRGYGKCGQKIVGCKSIDSQVIEALLRIAQTLSPEVETNVNLAISQRAEFNSAMKHMKELQTTISQFNLSWEHGFVSKEDFLQRRRLLQLEIDKLEQQDQDSQTGNAVTIRNFGDAWEATKSDEEKQQLIDTIVQVVVIRDEKVERIVLRGQSEK